VVLFDTATLMAYCIAAIALVIAPGPGQALILARTVEGGTRAGVLTALGLEIGTLVHTLAAALGLSVILATSATAFTVVKYAGAAYLVALGSIAIWHAGRTSTVAASMPHVDSPSGSRLVVHAAVTGVLNPKVAVFFVAFLPQFVDPIAVPCLRSSSRSASCWLLSVSPSIPRYPQWLAVRGID
jgi:threonine/homoserine/homoserine lactone efflux protein